VDEAEGAGEVLEEMDGDSIMAAAVFSSYTDTRTVRVTRSFSKGSNGTRRKVRRRRRRFERKGWDG